MARCCVEDWPVDVEEFEQAQTLLDHNEVLILARENLARCCIDGALAATIRDRPDAQRCRAVDDRAPALDEGVVVQGRTEVDNLLRAVETTARRAGQGQLCILVGNKHRLVEISVPRPLPVGSDRDIVVRRIANDVLRTGDGEFVLADALAKFSLLKEEN